MWKICCGASCRHSSKTENRKPPPQRAQKYTEERHRGKPQRKTTEENHRGKPQRKTTEENHRGKPQRKTTEENHRGKPQRKTTEENHRGKPQRTTPLRFSSVVFLCVPLCPLWYVFVRQGCVLTPTPPHSQIQSAFLHPHPSCAVF